MIQTNRCRAASFVAILLLAGVLAACSDAPTAAPDAGSLLARQVAALGFRADMIEDHGDFVLVEGDIYLSKAQLHSVPLVSSGDPLRPSFQYRTTNLVSSANVHDIRVDLSGLASQPGWQTAAREALTHWSGITDSYVRMIESGPADITVATTCTSSSVAAFASFPSGGNAGPTVYVNTCFGYSTTHAQKVHNMVHEFGHTLGFRHTNWQSRGEGTGSEGAVHITYTPTGNDSGSVMNGGTALNSWAGFSTYDRVGTVRLYPLPAPSSVGISYPGGTPTLSWAPVFGATHYRIRFYQYSSWYSPEYGSTWTHTYSDVGTTSGTTYADGSRAYTGTASCYYYYPSADEEEYRDHHYSVEAIFANGWSGTIVMAAVVTC